MLAGLNPITSFFDMMPDGDHGYLRQALVHNVDSRATKADLENAFRAFSPRSIRIEVQGVGNNPSVASIELGSQSAVLRARHELDQLHLLDREILVTAHTGPACIGGWLRLSELDCDQSSKDLKSFFEQFGPVKKAHICEPVGLEKCRSPTIKICQY